MLSLVNEIGDHLKDTTPETKMVVDEKEIETEIKPNKEESILMQQTSEQLLDHAVNEFINQAILSLKPIILSISTICDAHKQP